MHEVSRETACHVSRDDKCGTLGATRKAQSTMHKAQRTKQKAKCTFLNFPAIAENSNLQRVLNPPWV